jgi:hypothetical protein
LLPGERYFTPSERTPNELRRLPQIAMELLWPVDVHSEDLQPCAILRWISKFGDNQTITFGPEHARHARRRQESKGGIYDRYDALEVYPNARMFHVRLVTRDALIDIAEALR